MTNRPQPFEDRKPRVGDPIHYEGKLVGHVTRVEGNLCWRSYPDGESLPFIWRFTSWKPELNRLHDWPTKGGGKPDDSSSPAAAS